MCEFFHTYGKVRLVNNTLLYPHLASKLLTIYNVDPVFLYTWVFGAISIRICFSIGHSILYEWIPVIGKLRQEDQELEASLAT